MSDGTQVLIVVLAVGALLAGVYLMSKPKKSSGLTIDNALDLAERHGLL